jgi:tetratricopeptide (TPR) repeat protein
MNRHAEPLSQDSLRAFYDTAMAHLRAGELEAAEQVARRAQAIYPRDPNITCLLGEISLRCRRPQEAQSWFGRTLKHFPGFPRALEGTGRALLEERRPVRAVSFLERAARAVPDRVNTHLVLARALSMAGQLPEAEAAFNRALSLDPERAVVARAAEAYRDGQAHEAERLLREHLKASPDDPIALRLLAQIGADANQARPAMRMLKRCVEIAPDFVLAWNDLANLYMQEERYEEALETAEHALALDPGLPHGKVIRANVLSRAQRHEEALAAYREALADSPGHAGALSGRGHVLKTIGRTDEAIEAFRECIHAHPTFGEAYWSLANLKTFSFDPEEVAIMERLIEDDELPDETRVNVLYSLGKHRENQGDYAGAFVAFERGAAMRREHEVYDPVQTQVVHDRIIEVITPEFLEAREGFGDPAPDPILIVGMPRSGSTLIEQILASHSQVEGTMELPDLARCIREINRAGKGKIQYPEALRHMNREDLTALGSRYLETTSRYRTGKAYFIDKMPNNFAAIGLLHLILPNAKVIDARRHPLDSCLGTWKQLFFKGQAFTYDFFELGHYFLQYRRIMAHWHAVLPGKVLDVHYENVVGDLEGQVRRLLDHCGLPFEEGCLRFWETRRAVNTASSEQVRQPLYTKALNFWRNYEPQLEPLIDVLEPELVMLPADLRPEKLRSA